MSPLEFDVEIEPERLSTGETIYVASCTELDIASQGETVEKARQNLVEALTLWLETASPTEIDSSLSEVRRRRSQIYTTRIAVPYG